MLTTNPSRGADQLPPLSEMAQRASDECQAYAIENGLFLHLLTEEHLHYHHDVARQEYARIPYAGEQLDAGHLPVFEIPPVTISDSWTVHQRVALVLESACVWLTDEELKQHEEAVADRQQKKVPQSQTFDGKKPKLECPLIASDHDEDCAELRRTVARYHRYNGRRLNEELDNNNIDSGISDVPDICGEDVETMLQSETIAVNKLTIDCLMAHIEYKDQKMEYQEYILSSSSTPGTRRRRFSSPLPPVFHIDEYIPEGDVCCISEPSEPSSSIGEYAETAANKIPQRGPTDFVETTEPIESYVARTNVVSGLLVDAFDRTEGPEFPREQAEESTPLFELTHLEAADEVLQTTEEEDVVFGNVIAESVCSSASGKTQELGEIPPIDQMNGFTTSKSQSGDGDEGFQTVTADLLLEMEENETAKQAKIPVPDLDPSKNLPEWHGIASSPKKLLQWIMSHEMGKATFLESETLQSCRYEMPFGALDASNIDINDKEWDSASDGMMKKVTSWMEDGEAETWSLVYYRAVEAEFLFDKCQKTEEELEVLPFSHTKKAIPVITKRQEAEPSNLVRRQKQNEVEPSPQTAPLPRTPRTKHANKDTWGELMERFKKRKTDLTTEPPMGENGDNCKITAPELLIGSRAFMSASVPEHNKVSTGEDSTVDYSEVGEDTDLADVDLPLVEPGALPKVILSTAVPRVIRTRVLKLLPDLKFVERDFSLYVETTPDIDMNDEVDIVTTPRSGIITTTMVSLRQMDSHRRPLFQRRLAKAAKKYETLSVLVYRNGSMASRTSMTDSSLDISPSDALAFSQLLGFTKTLLCDTRVKYVSGGETAVAKIAAKLISTSGTKECTISESYLVEEATREEQFLRLVGLNVYDAQIVAGMARKKGSADIIQSLTALVVDDGEKSLGGMVGCRRALGGAKKLLTINIQ